MALLLAGVTGLWSMSREVAAMAATMNSWTTTFSTLSARVHILEEKHNDGQHKGADRRLNALENLHQPDSPHLYPIGGGGR